MFAMDLADSLGAMGEEVQTVALVAGSQLPGLQVDVLGSRPRGFDTLRALRHRMSHSDITVAHGSSTAFACSVAGGNKTHWVYRQISDTRFWADSLARRARVHLYLKRASAIVALSEGAKTDLIEHLKLKDASIHVVPNGVPQGAFVPATDQHRLDARKTLGLPEDGVLALFVGALVPEKGADVAIRALAHAPSVTLVVAGGGPEYGSLTELARTFPGRVFMLGVLEGISTAYTASDFVVLPSLGGDSMPATLIEAGFCELPAIATPVGSIAEIVVDGLTGVIVPCGNVQELGDAMELMASGGRSRSRLGSAARDRCQRLFEIDVVAGGWKSVLERSVAFGRT